MDCLSALIIISTSCNLIYIIIINIKSAFIAPLALFGVAISAAPGIEEAVGFSGVKKPRVNAVDCEVAPSVKVANGVATAWN